MVARKPPQKAWRLGREALPFWERTTEEDIHAPIAEHGSTYATDGRNCMSKDDQYPGHLPLLVSLIVQSSKRRPWMQTTSAKASAAGRLGSSPKLSAPLILLSYIPAVAAAADPLPLPLHPLLSSAASPASYRLYTSPSRPLRSKSCGEILSI